MRQQRSGHTAIKSCGAGAWSQTTASEPRIYVQIHDEEAKVYVAVHVDSFGIPASTIALKEETMAVIQEVFKRVEGDLGFYL